MRLSITSARAPRSRAVTATAAALLAALVAGAAAVQPAEATTERTSVIVRERTGAGDEPESAVARFGGEVGRQLPIIDGFVAEVPADLVDDLEALPSVAAVTPNATVELSSGLSLVDTAVDEVDALRGAPGAMDTVVKAVEADRAWEYGITGKGVDVAVLDTGVTRVEGLDAPGKVIDGVDVSFDTGTDRAFVDGYGHGTHLAGIIAGRDANSTATSGFRGIAPDARIVNVKAGDHRGVVDVSQVIAAIGWVVHNRHSDGMNIRVLNLSFGTNGHQDYRYDPLTYAAEVAWRKGIVVVAAAGNSGAANGRMTNPAYHPLILAVGASDHNLTNSILDDTIPEWSSRGDGVRDPDIVAPGRSIVSVRAPGSVAEASAPSALVGERFMKGSGTSQSAAVVSGLAALVLDYRPDATPDQVKDFLIGNATPLPAAHRQAQGAGLPKLTNAVRYGFPTASQAAQHVEPATGTGSLEAARGDSHVEVDGTLIEGEIDVTGATWSGATWSGATWSGATWSGASWSGASWSGATWSGATWSGASWSGASWSADDWSSAGWLGMSWN